MPSSDGNAAPEASTRANDPERIFGLYKTMCVIRAFEEAAHRAFVEGHAAGSIHQSIGQEAVPTGRIRPQDWRCGDKIWVVEVIAPFGGAEEMVKDLKANVFKDREVKYLAVGADGAREVRAV